MSTRKSLSPDYISVVSNVLSVVEPQDLLDKLLGASSVLTEPNYAHFHNMLAKHSPANVSKISQEMQNSLYTLEGLGSDGWSLKSTRGLKSITQVLQASPSSAPIFACSRNGYVREKAVLVWPRVNSAFELALLIIRLNDWVAPVRRATVKKLEQMTSMSQRDSGLTAEVVLGCMELILDPTRFGRSRDVELGLLETLRVIKGVPTLLEAHIRTNAEDSAYHYLKLGLRAGLFKNDLSEIAVNAKHFRVRNLAMRTLLMGENIWKLNGQLQRVNYSGIVIDKTRLASLALEDKSAIVQRTGLDYILDEKPEALHREETYREFLNSKRISIVERAVFGLKSLGTDWMVEARIALEKGEVSKEQLILFARYGSADDADKIFELAIELDAEDQIYYWGAAAKIGNKSAINALEAIALNSRDNAKARRAVKWLSKSSYRPDIKQIIELIDVRKDIRARDYFPFILGFPTMKLAEAIAAMMQADLECNYENMWRLLAKKRNTGAFLPSNDEIESLAMRVGKTPSIKVRMERILGIAL